MLNKVLENQRKILKAIEKLEKRVEEIHQVQMFALGQIQDDLSILLRDAEMLRTEKIDYCSDAFERESNQGEDIELKPGYRSKPQDWFDGNFRKFSSYSTRVRYFNDDDRRNDFNICVKGLQELLQPRKAMDLFYIRSAKSEDKSFGQSTVDIRGECKRQIESDTYPGESKLTKCLGSLFINDGYPSIIKYTKLSLESGNSLNPKKDLNKILMGAMDPVYTSFDIDSKSKIIMEQINELGDEPQLDGDLHNFQSIF